MRVCSCPFLLNCKLCPRCYVAYTPCASLLYTLFCCSSVCLFQVVFCGEETSPFCHSLHRFSKNGYAHRKWSMSMCRLQTGRSNVKHPCADNATSSTLGFSFGMPMFWCGFGAGVKLKGTLLFCAVSDEEAGGEDGAKYVDYLDDGRETCNGLRYAWSLQYCWTMWT